MSNTCQTILRGAQQVKDKDADLDKLIDINEMAETGTRVKDEAGVENTQEARDKYSKKSRKTGRGRRQCRFGPLSFFIKTCRPFWSPSREAPE